MNWTQSADPLRHPFLSALIAALPVLLIFWALVVKKLKGHQASLLAALFAFIIAIVIYRMPVQLAAMSFVHGALYGLFPISWIVLSILFLFNLTVASGQFEIIKHSMASITGDRRLQVLLVAFSFGAFLEGTAGFGAPVAISAAMLTGLGFDPLYAAGLCLIANTTPVAFGSIGIPITVASQVSGIPEFVLSQMIGRTLPILSFMLPFYLITLMCGFKKAVGIWPAMFVSGFSFAVLQWFCSNYIGPFLPDIIAGGGSILCLVIFLRFWQPKQIWYLQDDQKQAIAPEYSRLRILRAWSPFLILTILIVCWGIKPVSAELNRLGTWQINMPWIHQAITDTRGNAIPHIFRLNTLSAAGTAIFISALISILLTGTTISNASRIFLSTLRQLKKPFLTVSAILGFAYLVNDSGMSVSMANALAATGILYPFFAPVLGWLGVFITGSDTSSNALFSTLQHATATAVGVDPVVTVAANSTGGVVGKMISPQSIAVGAAAAGLVGKEANLFRFTVKHSFILLAFICILTLAQAYWIKWIVPVYHPAHPTVTRIK